MTKKSTFKHFLNESHYIGDEDSISDAEAAETIKTRCNIWEQYCGNVSKNILYRGMSVMFSPDILIKSPRRNRRPLTTNTLLHNITDEVFKEKFGEKFRSNAVFATRDKEIAKHYGSVYAIFPLDQMSFCWSPNVEDFTFISYKHFYDKGAESLKFSRDFKKEDVVDFIDSKGYKNNDDSLKDEYFREARYRKHEVMITCDEFLAISLDKLPNVLKLLWK